VLPHRGGLLAQHQTVVQLLDLRLEVPARGVVADRRALDAATVVRPISLELGKHHAAQIGAVDEGLSVRAAVHERHLSDEAREQRTRLVIVDDRHTAEGESTCRITSAVILLSTSPGGRAS
jgi:hypothetical protein